MDAFVKITVLFARGSVTFWTHPEIIPVGQFFRRWIRSINQSNVDFHCKPLSWLIDWRWVNLDLIGLLDSHRTICFYGGGAKVAEHRGTAEYINIIRRGCGDYHKLYCTGCYNGGTESFSLREKILQQKLFSQNTWWMHDWPWKTIFYEKWKLSTHSKIERKKKEKKGNERSKKNFNSALAAICFFQQFWVNLLLDSWNVFIFCVWHWETIVWNW